MITKIGPSFPVELKQAGLLGLPFAWSADGQFSFDSSMSQAQKDAVLAIVVVHDPTKPAPHSEFVTALDAAILAVPSIDPRIKAVFVEWRKQIL